MEKPVGPDALCVPLVVHRAGRILHWNEAARTAVRRLGYEPTPSGPAGGIWAVLHPDEHGHVLETYARIVETGRPLVGVRRVLRDVEGRAYRVLATVQPTVWQGQSAVVTTFLLMDPLPGARATEHWHRMEPLPTHFRDAAMLAAQGVTEDRISAMLGLPVSEVRDCLDRVYRRLGVRSRIELMELLAG